jgi:TPR repeat protein
MASTLAVRKKTDMQRRIRPTVSDINVGCEAMSRPVNHRFCRYGRGRMISAGWKWDFVAIKAFRINRRLTLKAQDDLMSAPLPWLTRILAIVVTPAGRFARAETLASHDAHASAFKLFARAARAGLPRAQYRLGRCYLLGLGVPLSIGEALRWLGRAAEAGETAAQTQLAALALQGVNDGAAMGPFDCASGQADFERAEYWCRRAVISGSAEAKALLGFILSAGPAERRDEAAAEILYRESAQAGWSRGQLGSAMGLLHDGTKQGADRAAGLLRSAAGDGVAAAHYLLGMLAESGLVGSVDFAAAASSYQQAAELGFVPAQVRYGFALMHGRGIERDVFAAETWLRRAALGGSAQAAAVVGYLYARDGDLPPNYVEAAMWLQRAAEGEHVGAARTLGRMLMLGTGIPKDIPEAARWLCMAAAHGDEAARADLILLVLTRQVGERERLVVADWLREAAASGDPEAQYDLGLCLAQGIGAEKDNLAALRWVRRSAEGGHPRAAQMVAQLTAPI